MSSHAHSCTRRFFLTRSPILVGSSALFPACERDPFSLEPDSDAPRTDGLHLYIDESGTPSGGGIFVAGALVAQNPVKHERRIQQLRREHRYYTELRYSSTDRFRVPFARAVIRYITGDRDLRFMARVAEGDVAEGYVDLYATLLQETVAVEEPFVAHVERRSSGGRDRLLQQELLTRVRNLRRVEIIDGSAGNELGQVADLLTGSIYGEMSGVRDRAKAGLLAELRSQLGVSRLLHASVAGFRCTV
ncbi:MAG: hypothetical protein HY702_08245 [Gemmatimonadetes bacterium]|nr:hypothetical protein [Gemmatimonadota bacterium]